MADSAPAQHGAILTVFYDEAKDRPNELAAPAVPVIAAPNLPSLYTPFHWEPSMKRSEDLPGRTPLEKILAYLDSRGDGRLTWWRTAGKLRELGWPFFASFGASRALHRWLRSRLSQPKNDLLSRLTLRADVGDSGELARGGIPLFDAEGGIDTSLRRRLNADARYEQYTRQDGRVNAGGSHTLDDLQKALGVKDDSAGWRLFSRHFWPRLADARLKGDWTHSTPVLTAERLDKVLAGSLLYEEAWDEMIRRQEASKPRRSSGRALASAMLILPLAHFKIPPVSVLLTPDVIPWVITGGFWSYFAMAAWAGAHSPRLGIPRRFAYAAFLFFLPIPGWIALNILELSFWGVPQILWALPGLAGVAVLLFSPRTADRLPRLLQSRSAAWAGWAAIAALAALIALRNPPFASLFAVNNLARNDLFWFFLADTIKDLFIGISVFFFVSAAMFLPRAVRRSWTFSLRGLMGLMLWCALLIGMAASEISEYRDLSRRRHTEDFIDFLGNLESMRTFHAKGGFHGLGQILYSMDYYQQALTGRLSGDFRSLPLWELKNGRYYDAGDHFERRKIPRTEAELSEIFRTIQSLHPEIPDDHREILFKLGRLHAYSLEVNPDDYPDIKSFARKHAEILVQAGFYSRDNAPRLEADFARVLAEARKYSGDNNWSMLRSAAARSLFFLTLSLSALRGSLRRRSEQAPKQF